MEKKKLRSLQTASLPVTLDAFTPLLPQNIVNRMWYHAVKEKTPKKKTKEKEKGGGGCLQTQITSP